MGSNLVDVLCERGFVVVKLAFDYTERTLTTARRLENEGRLRRMATEFEPGYFGQEGAAKAIKLEMSTETPSFVKRSPVAAVDALFTDVMHMMQADSDGQMDFEIFERTPMLLSLPLLDEEDEEYPPDDVNDAQVVCCDLCTRFHASVYVVLCSCPPCSPVSPFIVFPFIVSPFPVSLDRESPVVVSCRCVLSSCHVLSLILSRVLSLCWLSLAVGCLSLSNVSLLIGPRARAGENQFWHGRRACVWHLQTSSAISCLASVFFVSKRFLLVSDFPEPALVLVGLIDELFQDAVTVVDVLCAVPVAR